MISDSSGRPAGGGCRKAIEPLAILTALVGALAGIVVWAIVSVAVAITLVVAAILASGGHGPTPGGSDFRSAWLELFHRAAVFAVFFGAVGGAVLPGAIRSLARWVRWRRALQPLLRSDPALRVQLLLPLPCKIVFTLDLLLYHVHLFLVLCGFLGGEILDEVPILKILAYGGLLSVLLGVPSDIMLLKGRSVAVVLGCLTVVATLGSIAVHGAGVISGPREPIHLTALMMLIPVLRAVWLSVYAMALFRFWRWTRLPKPEISATATPVFSVGDA